ncbi:hypothetical protein DAI22_02g368600 [Oryza sativa Japonica Group]|nr:hypothetical protein DAI22_02g368600 [Oryza sativa Japonica Group]
MILVSPQCDIEATEIVLSSYQVKKKMKSYCQHFIILVLNFYFLNRFMYMVLPD